MSAEDATACGTEPDRDDGRQTAVRSMTIDAHHHFWDPARRDYPWMVGDAAPLRRRFDPDDFQPLIAVANVDRTILVQTVSSLDETEEFLATAATTPFVAGVVGWVDLTDPTVGKTLASLQSGPNGRFLVGIRHQVHDEPDPEWLRRSDVRRGLREVAAAGVVYDFLLRPRELPAALATAEALPDLRFVIDHLAKPSIADGALEPWASLIAPFGDLPHVSCKLSGMVTEADWADWTPDDLRPFVAHAVATFGYDRLLFGSDWPVCELAAPYGRVKAALEATLGESDALERERVFGANAAALYRLPVDAVETVSTEAR